jgi:5S rRNA maturation endonuclease (ribonuclease M5)
MTFDGFEVAMSKHCVNGEDRTMQREDYVVYTDLENVVKEMNEYVDVVVVEGKHDKEALEEMGITKEIAMYSGSKYSYADFIEYLRLRYKRVAILTDYDKAGRRFNKKLSTGLEKEGVKVEKIYREKIRKILKTKGMRCIESVNSVRRRIF